MSRWFAVMAVIGAVLLPEKGLGIPVCLFHSMTGLDCPACGLTRSLSCLARGHLAESFHLHPFGLIIGPILVVMAAAVVFHPFGRWLDAGLGRSQGWMTPFYRAAVAGFLIHGALRMLVQAAGC